MCSPAVVLLLSFRCVALFRVLFAIQQRQPVNNNICRNFKHNRIQIITHQTCYSLLITFHSTHPSFCQKYNFVLNDMV